MSRQLEFNDETNNNEAVASHHAPEDSGGSVNCDMHAKRPQPKGRARITRDEASRTGMVHWGCRDLPPDVIAVEGPQGN